MSAGTGSDELGTGSDTMSAGTGSDELGTGSDTLSSGSGEAGGSDFGSGDIIVDGSLEGGSTDEALALGSLAAVSIGIGLAVSGGVNLPGLPEINVGLVCNLPPEAIDFLKDNGSMEQDECEPEEEQN